MEISSAQTRQPEQPAWNWPVDDQTPVDITPYYVSKYSKGGLSYWVGAARSIGPTAQDWEQRRKAPIVYLLKVGSDAIHERLYYRIARTLDLPQHHAFWAVTPLILIWLLLLSSLSQRHFFRKGLMFLQNSAVSPEKLSHSQCRGLLAS